MADLELQGKNVLRLGCDLEDLICVLFIFWFLLVAQVKFVQGAFEEIGAGCIFWRHFLVESKSTACIFGKDW